MGADASRRARARRSDGSPRLACVQLNPTEDDRLTIFTTAQLARATLDRGLPLNAPEAIALVCDEMHMSARTGESWDEVLEVGRTIAASTPVLDGVPELVAEIRLEVLLDEGTRLVVLREPFGAGEPGDPVRRGRRAPRRRPRAPDAHGHEHRRSTRPGLEPLPVLGHEPVARVRPRGGAGVPAGSARPATRSGGRRARSRRSRSSRSGARAMPDRLSRDEHALRHGPTAGDRVRLGDTDLWIRIEEDLTEPGDQALWGYAKNWRSRMTQHDRATTASELDAVIGVGDRRRPAARRREVRPRDQGRPDRRDRAGREPGHHRRRRPHDRAEHVADPVPRADRDARDRRLARAPAVAAARAGRPVGRRDDPDHRRVRGTARRGCARPTPRSSTCP